MVLTISRRELVDARTSVDLPDDEKITEEETIERLAERYGVVIIKDNLEDLEQMIGKGLSPNFLESLSAIYECTRDKRIELAFPKNPLQQASYVIAGEQSTTRLADSWLIRVTDIPQSYLGIIEHEKIDEISKLLEMFTTLYHLKGN